MTRRLVTLLVMVAVAAMTPRAQQSQPQTFRGAVDLIAVDVQVMDRAGQPVAGLGPEKFEVTINGRKRRVVSADLISASAVSRTPPIQLNDAAAATAATAAPTPVAQLGRIVILAVDCTSFNVGVARGAMMAAKTFIERLPPDDMVGLFAYPIGPKVDPTLDHAAVVKALDAISGQRDTGTEGEFHLRPSEIVDLAAWADNLPGYGGDLALKICGADQSDPDVQQCLGRLRITVKSSALAYEGQGYATLGMLRSLLHGLAGVTGRKTVVLISAGTVASNIPGGRPDLTDIGLQLGKAAAEANVAIYTLFIDQGWLEQYTAETRRPNVSLGSARDSDVLGRWLDLFSGSAGGALMKVLVGNGEYAYDRMLAEMSAYYLLGVEPAEADRDGRTHQMKIKVSQRDVTVRGRTWVVVPKRNATPVAAAPTGSDKPSVPTSAAPVTAAPPRPLPEPVQSLAGAFERGDYAGMYRALAQTNDLANAIGDFRASDSPWPTAPRRTAVFALEMALAGLASHNGFARDQGIKLLAEYITLVRQPVAADSFECYWYWTAVAGLEGLRLSETGLVLVTRALQRCPTEPRFSLARAVITEQQTGDTRAGDVLLLYEAAMKFSETEPEARVRAAWFCYRTGKVDRAFELIGGAPSQSSDPHVRYLHDLVKGHVLRARGQIDGAAEAFRAALATWPGAQSARVALMTLLLGRGDRQEAELLADAVQNAPDTQLDPWWTFGLGDFRVYPAILAELRALGR